MTSGQRADRDSRTDGDERRIGIVTRGIGGFYDVALDGGGTVRTRLRGRFRKESIRPLVGDRVHVHVREGGDGVIEGIEPRKTELVRPSIANVDQVVIVLAMRDPNPDRLFLDRLLVAVRSHGLDVLLCLNKVDLVAAEDVEPWVNVYRDVVTHIFLTSAKTGQGVDELTRALIDRISTLAGPSGAGKSALLNAIDPDFQRLTGKVSQRLGHGRHTTRAVELLPLPEGGWIADTPGFSQIDLSGIPPEGLTDYFPDFSRLAEGCRFIGCAHVHEPDCAVRAAYEQGQIEPSRYRHYLHILEELQAWQERQYR